MKAYTIKIIFIMLLPILFSLGCQSAQDVSLWQRHCEACHAGKTTHNGNVVMDKEQMKIKYKTLNEFVNACGGSASCMNILKHDKKLFEEVGKEIGIK